MNLKLSIDYYNTAEGELFKRNLTASEADKQILKK